MYGSDPPAARRWLILGILLAAVVLACTLASAPPTLRGVVVEAKSARTYQGDMLYFLTIEYRDASGALVHERCQVGMREWLLFGVEGREVCINPDGRMVRCPPTPSPRPN